jgi:hypothetical protein
LEFIGLGDDEELEEEFEEENPEPHLLPVSKHFENRSEEWRVLKNLQTNPHASRAL